MFADSVMQVDTYAAKPFDQTSTGDCVFRSSDGVRYKVHKVVLSLASPVFHDMFDMPQDASRGVVSGPLPEVEVAESHRVLDAMFRLVYPIPKAQLTSHDVAFEVARAYDKYMIDFSTLIPFLSDLLSHNAFRNHPIDAYTLAWRVKLKSKAQEASQWLHSADLHDDAVKSRIVNRAGDINALLALWELRYRRELALDDLVEALPVTKYRCSDHQTLTPAEYKRLRAIARKALMTPTVGAEELIRYLDFYDIFHPRPAPFHLTSNPGSTLTSAFITTLASPGSPTMFTSQPWSASKQSPPNISPADCAGCKKLVNDASLKSMSTSLETDGLKKVVSKFPQHISWPTKAGNSP